MIPQSSNPVSAVLPAGAYVIRNRQALTVLHIPPPDTDIQDLNILANGQNEDQFKDQQIWWIEPLADYVGPGAEKGVLYSITSPSSGRSLCVNPKSGCVLADIPHGEPWHRWRLRKVDDPENREVLYNIINAMDDAVLAIDEDCVGSGSWIDTKQYSPEHLYNRWEFMIPVIAFPPGWFHIQNARTGDLLSHDYDYNPPLLLPRPETVIESQFRRQWQFQWTLSHSRFFEPSTAGERNSWYIINRLTRIPLSPHFGTIGEADFAGHGENLTWRLELDTSRHWKLINRTSSCLLEQTESISGGSTSVRCTEKWFEPETGHKSWILEPPVVNAAESEVGIGLGKEDFQKPMIAEKQLSAGYKSCES